MAKIEIVNENENLNENEMEIKNKKKKWVYPPDRFRSCDLRLIMR